MEKPMGNKVRVLIVDDQQSIRDMLKEMIDKLGGEVVGEAGDGEDALDKFTQLTPDIVLLDINMPKMDGVEALKRMHAENSKALIVMLTSQNTAAVVRDCITNGASNFLLKSNPVEVLFEELKSTWAEHRKALQAG